MPTWANAFAGVFPEGKLAARDWEPPLYWWATHVASSPKASFKTKAGLIHECYTLSDVSQCRSEKGVNAITTIKKQGQGALG